MEALNNYKKYKEFKPEYSNWSKNRDITDAKRQEYLKRNKDSLNQDDIKRAKSLLHAIDIMDEYSQKNAEDMEVATEAAASTATGLVSTAGMLLGMSAIAIPAVQKRLNNVAAKYPKMKEVVPFIPVVLGYIASIAASVPIMAWAAKVQVTASRKGRFEAMRNDLSNPNNFAVLTDEQIKKAKEDAKNIKLEEEDKKKSVINTGFSDTMKNLKKLIKKDTVYEQQKADFEKALDEQESHFNEKLSEKDIEKAKRDKQMLGKLVEKIDIASQDYAENIEMATNMLTFASIESGFLTGWLANKAIKALKINPANKTAMFLPYVLGTVVMILPSIFAAKIQKQASRVGRFKARQELLNKPESLVYVDDKKTDSIKDVQLPEQKKKPNIFKFFIQAYKDNKEYTKYMKNEGLQDKKFHKALENQTLSEQQLKDAKMLQKNTFKTFNKVDEKSQTYAESVEALGQSLQLLISFISTYAGMGLAFLSGRRDMNKIQKLKGTMNETLLMKKAAGAAARAMAVYITTAIVPVCVSEYFITKEQKKASRIADMLALKELDDYRHYVDYNNLEKPGNLTPPANTKSLMDKLLNK